MSISDIEVPTHAVTDTIFLTNMQKRGKSAEPINPLITRKHNLAKNGYGGDMLKNLQTSRNCDSLEMYETASRQLQFGSSNIFFRFKIYFFILLFWLLFFSRPLKFQLFFLLRICHVTCCNYNEKERVDTLPIQHISCQNCRRLRTSPFYQ